MLAAHTARRSTRLLPLARRAAALAALGLGAALHASPFYPESRLPELATLLEKARENSPELVAQSLAQEESLARLDAAKAAYYPRLDLSTNVGYRLTEYDSSTADDEDSAGANFYAVIRRPLYHWGAIEARIKQARLDQTGEDLQRVLVLRQIKRGLRADYLALLVNQASLANLRIRRELAAAQLTRLEADREAGLVSALDAERLQLDQEQTVLEIEELETERARILAAYRRQLGWDAPLALDQPVPSPDLDAVLAWVGQTRSAGLGSWTTDHAEVLRRQGLLEREKAELVWIKSRQRPLLNLSASALRDQRNVGLENNVDAMTYFVGLDVSWNVFDGFETSARAREARLRLRRQERQLEAYRAEIAAQAYDLVERISLQARRLQLDEKRARSAAEDLRLAEREASDGRLSAQGLRERRLSAQESSLQALRARVALLLALNDFLDLTLPAAVELPPAA